jgi:hypothetical protein
LREWVGWMNNTAIWLFRFADLKTGLDLLGIQ